MLTVSFNKTNVVILCVEFGRGIDMKKIFIEDIKNYENQEITLQAWLYNKRSSGKLHFLQLRDGTGEIQAVVFKGNVSEEVFELADKITQESSVEVVRLFVQ